jgi:O-antigen ligase
MTTAVAERPLAGYLGSGGLGVAPVAALTLIAAGAVGATVLLGPAVPVGLAIALLVAVVAWQRPLVAGVVVVAGCPALSGVSRSLGLGALKISELLLVLMVTVVVLRGRVAGQRLRAADVGLLALAGLGAFFAVLHTVTGTSSPASMLRVGLQLLMLFLTYWTVSRSVRTPAELAVVVRWLLILSLAPASLAILQAFDVPGIRSLLIRVTGGPSLAVHGAGGLIRATGPFPIWHSLAAYLLIAVVLSMALLLRPDRRVAPQPVVYVVAAVDVAALVLSVTAPVVGWAAVAVLVLAALRGRFAQAALLLAAATGLAGIVFAGTISARVAEQSTTSAVALHEERSSLLPQTIAYRLSIWERDYVPLLGRAVPYGVANELPESAVFQHAENQYILLALRGGLLLLLGALAAMAVLGRDLLRAARGADQLVAVVAAGMFGVLIFLPVSAMVWPYLTNAGFPQAFLAVTGAVAGAGALRRRTATA